MSTFVFVAIGVLVGMALHALILWVRRDRSVDETEQLQKARAATTPADWRPL